jgi:hypothetical protein
MISEDMAEPAKDIRKTIVKKPTTSKIQEITTIEREIQPENSYTLAYEFVTRFKNWLSGTIAIPNPEIYEQIFTIQMSMVEWVKLETDLKLSKSDDQSVFLL